MPRAVRPSLWTHCLTTDWQPVWIGLYVMERRGSLIEIDNDKEHLMIAALNTHKFKSSAANPWESLPHERRCL